MNEERRMILEMVSTGSITVEEAERLMEALPQENEESARPTGGRLPKRIRVNVTENGRTIVNVRLPFSLVKAALKIGKTGALMGAKYAKEEDERLLSYISEIDIDEILESVSDGEITLPYTMVDVDEPKENQHVEVVLE